MNSLRIVHAVQTCAGCPSQWDAWTADGTYLYLRFRWGVGTATLEHGTTRGDGSVAHFETDDPYDGIISLTSSARAPASTSRPTRRRTDDQSSSARRTGSSRDVRLLRRM